ncbi:MAG: nucleotide-binding protein [Acidovorax sp.]|uniref:nucleotide-binding protein n=1 Tax=Acidovorax sp. TaxID=1872122 RepID=UPI0025BA337D|nr:nucleotide-binding protein [Acidovorax sp.]MCE1192399.1 nucleotide-binding protein [Acidovorax sp.]
MNKKDVIAQLDSFRSRLEQDVAPAYEHRGSDFGSERFAAWKRQFEKFLDASLPGTSSRLAANLRKSVFYRGRSESDLDVFMREDGEPCAAFIDSLILDIQNGEFEEQFVPIKADERAKAKSEKKAKRIFVVHGHDDLLKTKTARFIEKLGYDAVILHEQASRGMTIIEKIEAHTDVDFAIVLYSPDDQGNTTSAAAKGELLPRARQNVIFEHGYLMAKLSRAHVVPLVSGKIELPSDISGVVYVDDTNWQFEIAKEMRAAGYEVDFNRLLDA